MIRLAAHQDAEQIRTIYSPFVTDTAVSFELEPPTAEEISRRIEETLPRYPWLVWEQDDRVLGYAYASSHRARPAYQWSVEVSVYIHPYSRRMGVARQLYTRLFNMLIGQGYCNAYAGITLPNDASVGFHEAMGFQPVGVYSKIGFKMGKWHDVGWWQLRLREAERPVPPRRPSKGNIPPQTSPTTSHNN